MPFFCLDIIHTYLNHPHFNLGFSLSALLDSHIAFHYRDPEENATKFTWSAWCLTMCPSLQLLILPFPHNSFSYRIFGHLVPAVSSHQHLHLLIVCVCCPQMLYPVLSCLCGKQYWSLVFKYLSPKTAFIKPTFTRRYTRAFKQKL